MLLASLFPHPALASNLVGFIANLCPSANGCPAAAPSASPTPTSGGGNCALPNGVSAVDPNLDSFACKELQWFYNQRGHGVMESAQLQFGVFSYGNGNNLGTNAQASINAQNGVSNGTPIGMIAIDPCSINQQGGYPECGFGPSSAADIMAKQAWADGYAVSAHMDATNPIDNWQNLVNNYTVNATQCPPGASGGICNNGACWGTIYDCTNNSGESWPTYVQRMITVGTTENSHWNTEVDNFAQSWLDLQASGIPVVLGPFQEWDGSSMWHNEDNIPNSLLSSVISYTEQRWMSEGVHNLIYINATNSGVTLPNACGILDMAGYDFYSNPSTTPYTYPQYSNGNNGFTACGKPNVPQGIQEYGMPSGTYNNLVVSMQNADPNMIYLNCWSIGSCGTYRSTTTGGSTATDPSWLSAITNPYTVQLGTVSANR